MSRKHNKTRKKGFDKTRDQSNQQDGQNQCELSRLLREAVGVHRTDSSQAEALYRSYLVKGGSDAVALNNLGVLLKARGERAEAQALLHNAIRNNAHYADPHINLGSILLEEKKYSAAIDSLIVGIRLKPSSFAGLMNLAESYKGIGDSGKAIDAAEKALALRPESIQCKKLIGTLLIDTHSSARGISLLEDCRAGDKDDVDTRLLLATKYIRSEDYYKAKRLYGECRSALSSEWLELEKMDVLMNGYLCEDIECQGAKAIEVLRKGIRQASSGVKQLLDVSSMLMVLLEHTSSREDYAQFKRVNQDWSGELARRCGMQLSLADNKKDSGSEIDALRKLRIGLLGGDFRHHVVGRFLMPLFRHYRRDEVELVCFSTFSSPCKAQEIFRHAASSFLDVKDMSSEELSLLINEVSIDILIDLAGLTSHARPEIFASRHAPLQLSWLGYPDRTWIRGIDHMIVDDILAPENIDNDEKNSFLTVNGPFLCLEEWPAVDIRPRVRHKAKEEVWFGVTNHPRKYSSSAFDLWASVLEHNDNSRLIFVRSELKCKEARDNILKQLTKRCIHKDRIIFNYEPREEMLDGYNFFDYALDTFPYTGTTTTIDSLMMGVPVVSLRGTYPHQRASASVLHYSGMGEWIAETPTDYVRRAQQLATQGRNTTERRLKLREQIRRSDLCDGQKFTVNFMRTMKEAFERTR